MLFAHLFVDAVFRPKLPKTKHRKVAFLKEPFFWLSAAVYGAAMLLALLPQITVDRKTTFFAFGAMFSLRAFVVFARIIWPSSTLRAVWYALQSTALLLLLYWLTGLSLPWYAIRTALLAPEVWVVLVTYALAIWPAGTAVAALAGKWFDQIQEDPTAKGLEDGGLWIGRLERCLTVSFVLANHLEAIAALVVAKGVIRFAEIKEAGHRRAAEYIFIGSMASFGIALLLGWTARWILRQPALQRL